MIAFDFPEDGRMPTSDPVLREAIYEAFGGVDFYTGRPLAMDDMSIDHIIPRAKGGADNVFNYVPTSRAMNGAKSAKHDPVTVAPLIHIVRVHFGPRVMREIERIRERRAAATLAKRRERHTITAPRKARKTVVQPTANDDLEAAYHSVIGLRVPSSHGVVRLHFHATSENVALVMAIDAQQRDGILRGNSARFDSAGCASERAIFSMFTDGRWAPNFNTYGEISAKLHGLGLGVRTFHGRAVHGSTGKSEGGRTYGQIDVCREIVGASKFMSPSLFAKQASAGELLYAAPVSWYLADAA